MDEWYFAYASNLWADQMTARTGPLVQGDEPPRVARLPDHRLVFNMQGEDGQVYANVESPGDGVIGVLYRCGPSTLNKLDAYERGYDRCRVLVTDERQLPGEDRSRGQAARLARSVHPRHRGDRSDLERLNE
jgi:hypothetical protein